MSQVKASNNGNMAFDVILAPASSPRPNSPPKRKVLSMDDISSRLLAAEERRKSLEASKLTSLSDKLAKAEQAQAKKAEEEEKFVAEAEAKLQKKMEANKEKREAQFRALQDRLKEHERHVEEVRLAGEKYVDAMSTKHRMQIDKKLEAAEENRCAQIRSVMSKLKEHEKRVIEARQQSEVIVAEQSREIMEKLMKKMEDALANRDNQMKSLQDKIKEHERHCEDVRRAKMQAGDNVGTEITA
ncbi:PREDICTED: caldesmon-like isoform X2 [Priapulus caudatus]|uniref:Caldesmon-like isoform X2 n=1 Tax=Priapulus caudatus TaxID=37621 RepID=A0ABM1DVA0_PRICU|nr:PREDICTED: caldesmon-like isoform X2 [Priapulus caudatus]